jgi:hypothetical protein
MFSEDVATAAPVDALPWPVVAMADCAAVRTALLAAAELLPEDDDDDAADDPPCPSTLTLLVMTVALRVSTLGLLVTDVLVLLAEACVEDRLTLVAGGIAAGPVLAVGALTLPAPNCVVEVPLGDPPEVLIQICFRMSGRCQYCGATSMTT